MSDRWRSRRHGQLQVLQQPPRQCPKNVFPIACNLSLTRLCPGGKADTWKNAQRSITRTRVTPYTLIMPAMTSWTSSRFSALRARQPGRRQAHSEWRSSRMAKQYEEMCVWGEGGHKNGDMGSTQQQRGQKETPVCAVGGLFVNSRQ